MFTGGVLLNKPVNKQGDPMAAPSERISNSADRKTSQVDHARPGREAVAVELDQDTFRFRSSPVAFLTQGFRLTTGAPTGVAEIHNTPAVLRGVVEQIRDLARRVTAGEVSTAERRSTLMDAPAFLSRQDIEPVLAGQANDYIIEARVSRVQVEDLVKGLRTLGYDAVGLEMPDRNSEGSDTAGNSRSIPYSLLAIRNGFCGLDHLRDALEVLRMPAVSLDTPHRETMPEAAHAEVPLPAAGKISAGST